MKVTKIYGGGYDTYINHYVLYVQVYSPTHKFGYEYRKIIRATKKEIDSIHVGDEIEE